MIETLKELEAGTTIAFLNDGIIDFTEADQMKVYSVQIIKGDDDVEFVVVNTEDYCIVAYNFDTDPRYFLYQVIDEGSIEGLEQDGYMFLTDDFEFRSKVVSREEGRSHIYKHSEVGAMYDLVSEEAENEISVSLCEYISSSHHLPNMMAIMHNNEVLFILQGFEISEEDFNLVDDDDD